MTDDELRCDANFIYVPAQIMQTINQYDCTSSSYVGWLHRIGDDVILRIWAYRRTKKYGLEYREVIRATPHNEGLICRDMYLTYASGYRVVYKPGRAKSNSWYGYNYYAYDETDFGKWDWMPKIGIRYNILNLDILKDTQYKYCGYSGVGDFLDYIRLWIKYPETEYLGKMGIRPSVKLLQKAKKDKGFAKYLKKVSESDDKWYGVNTMIFAYDNGVSLENADKFCYEMASARRKMRGMTSIQQAELDYKKVLQYCDKQKCTLFAYDDYIRACIGIGLDLNDTKNSFPKEFRRMHDLRINQWSSKQTKGKSKEFKKAAKLYKKFEISNKKYTILIPDGIRDLQKEGKELDHCVGKMGYDKKMIKGISFIAFVRESKKPDVPFVTVEYGLRDNKVLQCYGYHDSKPQQEVIDFVNDWGKKVKKEMMAQ